MKLLYYLKTILIILFLNLFLASPQNECGAQDFDFNLNNILLQNYKLPIGLLELIFYGNAKKTNLDLEFSYEIFEERVMALLSMEYTNFKNKLILDNDYVVAKSDDAISNILKEVLN